MKANLSDRRKLNLRLESVLPYDERSPPMDSTPTFNMSIRHFDSDLESEHGKPLRIESAKSGTSKVIMFCIKCDRMTEEMKVLQYNLEEAQRNSKYLKSELERVMDLHKNSRLYAIEQKNMRLEQELKQILMDKRQIADENKTLKEKSVKQEKELRSSYISRQNSIKSVQSAARIPLIKLSFQHVCDISISPYEDRGKIKILPGKIQFLQVEEDDDSLHTSQNLDDIDNADQLFQGELTPKNHQVQEQFTYLNSNFRRLSNEFSSMLVMLESVIQIVFSGNSSPKLDENNDVRKTTSNLLVNLNNKLKNIQLIFLEIQEIKDPLKDFCLSPKNKEEESDDMLASRYVYTKKGTEKKFNLDINVNTNENKETEHDSDRIRYAEIIGIKNQFIHQINKELACVWDDCRDLKDKEKSLKNEIVKDLDLFKNQIIQNFNAIIIEITRKASKNIGDKCYIEKEIMKNREKYSLIIAQKDEQISRLNTNLKELKENEKKLSNTLFNLTKGRHSLEQRTERTSIETESSLKLKQKNKTYKDRVKKYKEKYENLKEEYNRLYLESKELLQKYEEKEAVLLNIMSGEKTHSSYHKEKDYLSLQRKIEKLETEKKSFQKDYELVVKCVAVQKIKLLTYEERLKELNKAKSELERFLTSGSVKKNDSESVEYLEKLLNEERKKNRSLTISFNLLKGNFNEIEKSFKENLEKITDLIENNSKLNIVIESLKAENKDLKEEFEETNAEKKEANEKLNKELGKLRTEATSYLSRGNLKNKLEVLEKDLEHSRNKFNFIENFKALDGKGMNLGINSDKLLENYKLLNQENIRLKEFLKLVC